MAALARLPAIPSALARRLARVPGMVARKRARRAIERSPAPAFDRPHVYYGFPALPGVSERASGGIVKFQRLAETYPNEPRAFNLLYAGSSSPPPDLRALLVIARRRGARIAWNQDGVAYPGLGWDMERTNEPMKAGLRAADHVFFQSEFCRVAADRFLGTPEGGWEILHNAVDTNVFTPAPSPPEAGPVLVLGGSQYQWYRIEVALRTLAAVATEHPDARLLVLGRLSWTPRVGEAQRAVARAAHELGVSERVELAGPYAQADAPKLLRRGHLLLHTKYNDPCPGAVIEAMACGLPVVYSASGGVPELVGTDAGVGVRAPFDFEHDHPPDPDALAAAVSAVLAGLDEYREQARARACAQFDIGPWIERHRVVFEELLAG